MLIEASASSSADREKHDDEMTGEPCPDGLHAQRPVCAAPHPSQGKGLGVPETSSWLQVFGLHTTRAFFNEIWDRVYMNFGLLTREFFGPSSLQFEGSIRFLQAPGFENAFHGQRRRVGK